MADRSVGMGAALSLFVAIAALPGAAGAVRADTGPVIPDITVAEQVSPALLRHWAGNSVNILESYRQYQELFGEKRRKVYDQGSGALKDRPNAFLLLADFNFTIPSLSSGNLVNIQTSEGLVRSSIQKTNMAVHAGYRAREQEFGAYTILDGMGLYLTREDAPGREHLFEGLEDDEPIGFDAGYIIPAVFWKGRDLELNVGGVVRMIPKTGRDSAGREVFRFEREGGGYEGTDYRQELFLDAAYRGYASNTLFAPEGRLEYLGLAADLEMGPLGVSPFFRYNRYRGRYQAGAALEKGFGESLVSRLELAGDTHLDSGGTRKAFYHAVAEIRSVRFRLPRSRLSEYSGYDFHMVLDHSASVSTDVLDEFAAGMGAGASLEDVMGLFSFRVGGGVNEYGYISVFPIRDRLIVNFRAQVAW